MKTANSVFAGLAITVALAIAVSDSCQIAFGQEPTPRPPSAFLDDPQATEPFPLNMQDGQVITHEGVSVLDNEVDLFDIGPRVEYETQLAELLERAAVISAETLTDDQQAELDCAVWHAGEVEFLIYQTSTHSTEPYAAACEKNDEAATLLAAAHESIDQGAQGNAKAKANAAAELIDDRTVDESDAEYNYLAADACLYDLELELWDPYQ